MKYTAVSGVVYWVAVSGKNAAEGRIRLNWTSVLATTGTAGTFHVFPQMAVGRLSDGSYYNPSLIVASANGLPLSSGITCTLRLYGMGSDLGVPSTLLIGVQPVSVRAQTLFTTAASAALRSGYATLQCPFEVEAQLIYSYHAANGRKLSEATVFSSPPSTASQLLADYRGGSRLGLAIANDSDVSATYTINVSNVDGVSVGSTSVTIAARGNRAAFLEDLIQLPLFSVGTSNPQFRVSISSSRPASVIGLRYTGNSFTTIPAVFPITASKTARSYHVFPQYADGVLGDGTSYQSTLMMINTTTATVNCTFGLRGLTVAGESSFSYVLTPGSWRILPSPAVQPFAAGYAALQCSDKVEAQLLYSYFASKVLKLSEATVFSSPVFSAAQIPLSAGFDNPQTGVAVANDSDVSWTYYATFFDFSGEVLGRISFTVPARSRHAEFVSEMRPTLYRPNGDRVGLDAVSKIAISSLGGGTVSLIGLRYTGSIFTTLPETRSPQ